jgi:hypothetical protein
MEFLDRARFKCTDVHDGRLVLDEPTELPEGEAVMQSRIE